MSKERIPVVLTRLKNRRDSLLFETMTSKLKEQKLCIEDGEMLSRQARSGEICSVDERWKLFKEKYRKNQCISIKTKMTKTCTNVPTYKLITFLVTIVIASILLTKSDIIDLVDAKAQVSLFNHPIYLPPSSSNRMQFASSPASSILKRDLGARQEAAPKGRSLRQRSNSGK